MGRNRRRRANRFQRRTLPGAPPGIVTPDPEAPRPQVDVIRYGDDGFEEYPIKKLDGIAELLGSSRVTWINVEGLGDASTIETLGEIFGLHPLAQEDVVNVHQRAKVEQYGDHLFIVARMVAFDGRLETEQFSLFLGRNFVVTFLEDPGDSFNPVRVRLRSHCGRVGEAGADYLAYALLDAVVDAYFPILEAYGDRLDEIEAKVSLRPDPPTLAAIHEIKRDLRTLRRAIWPLREAIHSLSRDTSGLITEETQVYLRDCYDHTVQVIDLLETYRELGSDLTDLYLSGQGNRLNEIMKVLTIIATIFMPLSFIAGIYGMNFDTAYSLNMPELGWRFGYLFSLSLMLAVAALMLYFFSRQGWLGALRLPRLKKSPPDSQAAGENGNGARTLSALPLPLSEKVATTSAASRP